MLEFRERIRALYSEMRAQDVFLSRSDFARRLGVSGRKINKWLDEGGNPDLETLKSIAGRADVTVAWLAGETAGPPVAWSELWERLPEEGRLEYHILIDFLRFKYRKEMRE